MPYLGQDVRVLFNEWLEQVPKISNPGQLNYIFTKIAMAYLGVDADYTKYNAALGAMEAAKLELYARVIRPYEDIKRMNNGDVY